MQRQRIAVVGVGAIGGAVAADLADVGRHDVVLCTRSPFERLTVTHPDGVSRADAPVLTRPSNVTRGDPDPYDWVLLATKAYQCEAAKPWLDALCGEGSCVAVLQNGVDHVERIAPLVSPAVDVLPVVVQLPAEKTSPGTVAQSRHGGLVVPEVERGRTFAQLFEGARTSVRTAADFVTQAWWKLLSNAALGGVCALTLRENGVVAEPEMRELVVGLMREIVAVGRAEGAQLPDDAPDKAIAVMLGVAGHWTSIAVDRREGRPMEWQVRNAVVGRLGRKHGIATPLNDALTSMLRAASAA